MGDPGFLLPDVDDPLTAPFWAGCARGQLLMQRFRATGRYAWPPRPMDPDSQTLDHEWVPVSGRASIYSFVVPHPPLLDAYAALLSDGRYQTIASLNELADRASFRIGGAIVQLDKKFTKKEGKPFAVVWLEDLTSTLEVVLWNEVYVPIADALLLGRVLAVQGTLDRRDDALRAVAQKAKVLKASDNQARPPNESNGNGSREKESPLVLCFSEAATAEEFRQVQLVLAASPGTRPVRLMFCRPGGESLQMEAGLNLCVNLTPELRDKLAPWLQSKEVAGAIAG